MTSEPVEALPASPAGRPSRPALLVRAARPKQWLKNVLVFAAPAAAGVLTQPHRLVLAGVAFGLFCVTASGTYLLNDVFDAEADRIHPRKRLRPVASGSLPVRTAALAGGLLLAAGLTLPLLVSWRLEVVFGVYVAVQAAYTLRLKHEPVYDLACVAAGFVVRAIAGGVAVGVPVSEWFLIVATFGSLLMVAGKRLAEQKELGGDGGRHRATLSVYSAGSLRTLLGVAVTGAVLGYCQWALALQTAAIHHHHGIWFRLSIAPMVLALLRYTWLVERGQGARPEDLVTSDRSMVALGLVWAALFGLGVYGG